MRSVCSLAAILFALLLLASPAAAQLPVASGRQFTLSNSAWKLFIPDTYQHRPGDVADVLVHFHGDPQTVWNNALYANLNTMVLTVNYSGLSSAYSGPFSNTSLFQTVMDEALARVRLEGDFSNTLEWDQLGVSSFSAGYGAVREILKVANYRNDIDSLLAADSLYATTSGDGTPLDSQMVNYKTFANLAQAGRKTFFFSHSQVLTYTYENTMETGNELMQSLGISADPINTSGLGTLDFYRHAQSGNFQLWGALGADGDAHLEHLRYIGQFLADLPLAHLPTLAADFDLDGDVDHDDFTQWEASFDVDALADADGDGDSDGQDFLIWQQQAGSGVGVPSSIAAVPEPSSAVLLAITALVMGSRRTRYR